MSVPHLDTRIIEGKKSLLFAPYAGVSTKFLKHGSLTDLFLHTYPNRICERPASKNAGKHKNDNQDSRNAEYAPTRKMPSVGIFVESDFTLFDEGLNKRIHERILHVQVEPVCNGTKRQLDRTFPDTEDHVPRLFLRSKLGFFMSRSQQVGMRQTAAVPFTRLLGPEV